MDGILLNDTLHIEFHILAFSTSKYGRILLLIAVLGIYLLILSSNFIIIVLVCLVSQLHTSMYFFLCNLSVLDILYVSTTLPKLLYITYTGDHVMSYTACLVQLYLFLFFADIEGFLLTSMAFDRYVAICFPLHYSLILSKQVCALLAFTAWFMAAINALIFTCLAIDLRFSHYNEVNNFFCDLKALLIISSSDTTFLKKCIMLDSILIGVGPLILILTSYGCIISTILKMKSLVGRHKAFSSCISHLTVVVMFYGSAMILYLQYSQEQDKLLSVMFATLPPMINPLVYSLRNKDIRRAMTRAIHGQTSMTNQ